MLWQRSAVASLFICLLSHHNLLGLQAERRALDAKQEFDHSSKLIKTEVARFEQERIEDFKESLQIFLEGMISRQKEVRILLLAFESLFNRTLLFTVDWGLGELSGAFIETSGRSQPAKGSEYSCAIVSPRVYV